jgi:ribosomal protein S21
MAIMLAPGESVDTAYRRYIREMVLNGTFKELEKSRYHIGSGQQDRDSRRQFFKTKRKRAQARRKNRNKRA